MLQSIPFKLLETMLYESDKDDIELWPYHLARLQKSIANFQLGVKLDFIKLRQAVDAKVKEFKSQESNLVYYSFYKDGQEVKKILRFRIRLLLSHDGTYEIQVANQEPMSNELGKLPTVNVKLDSAPIDKDSPYLYYKTTLRDVYNQSRERMGINKPENGLFDVILYNHNNEITETSIANLALEVETNGQKKFITPKLECGGLKIYSFKFS
ncbi:hypothetical protein K502DRAFT_323129 [Neoconidiobolus thromboides FSU 785]|nr:hypothetical protein K502DRAFT_323129 [Neoconidiobolus thromboides FSU 785]